MALSTVQLREFSRRIPRHCVLAAVLFLVLVLFYALLEVLPQYSVERLRKRGDKWQDHPSFLIGDCAYYRAALLSMWKDHDLDLRNNLQVKQYSPSENVALGERGEWYPKHPIAMSFAAIPFYALARDRGLITFNLVQLSALLLLIWYGARRYTTTALATALVFCFGFGTMMRLAAYNFAPDVFSTLLVVAGLVANLYGRALLGGLCLGFAVWAKWTNLVFVPLPALFYLAGWDWRAAIRYTLAAALPIAALLSLNYHMFGSPFTTPYDRVLIRHHGKLVIEASHHTFFTQPFWWGLQDQLFDPQMGLVVACPPCVLVPLGAALLARRFPAEALLLVSACAAQLAVFAKYDQWRESSYGPRFLMTVVALSALLVAPALERLFASRRAPS